MANILTDEAPDRLFRTARWAGGRSARGVAAAGRDADARGRTAAFDGFSRIA